MQKELIRQAIDALSKQPNRENQEMISYLIEVLDHTQSIILNDEDTNSNNLQFVDQIIDVYLNSFDLSAEAIQYLIKISAEIKKAPLSYKQQRLFLSYAWNDDQPFVEKLYFDLTKNGYDVWWDKVRLPSRGLTILQELRDTILSKVDRIIPIVGPAALESKNVQYEWNYARSICKTINPILRIGTHGDLPEDFQRLLYVDFREGKQYYETAFNNLLRILLDPIPPLGTLWGVPSLPPHYLARTEVATKVAELVLHDILKPTPTHSSQQVTVIHGMGGVGKSVFAASFAQTCIARRTFTDGIIWVTLGQDGDIPQKLLILGEFLKDDVSKYSTYIFAKGRLRELLQDKNCLLIIDDVWDITHADVFREILGPNCRALITTRDAGLATALGAKQIRLDVFNEDSALKLLAEWTDIQVEALPKAALEVSEECGNLPFALSLCGAMVKDGIPWTDLLEALHEADLGFIERRFPNYPYPNLLKALKVSIDMLAPRDYEFYKKLAVFEKDVEIPEETILLLWLHSSNISPRLARKLISDLDQKALLRLEGQTPNRKIILHDLNHDYLLSVLENVSGLHKEIVDAYRTKCPDGWYSGPNDGYFFDYIGYHLVKSGQAGELASTLKDLRYIARKTFLRNSLSVETDFILFERSTHDDMVMTLLKRNYVNSGHILNQCETLNDVISCIYTRVRNIDGVSHLANSLLPIYQNPNLINAHILPDLPHPGLIRTIFAHTDFINLCRISDNEALIASVSNDKTIKIWDQQTGIEKFVIKETNAKVSVCAFSADNKFLVSAAENGDIYIYDTHKFKKIKTFQNPSFRVTACEFISEEMLAVGTDNGKILILDLKQHQPSQVIDAHDLAINEIAVSSDRKTLVSASSDQTLKIWDIYSCTEINTLRGHKQRILGCSVSPTNTTIASSSDDHTAKTWDITAKQEIRTFKGHTQPVHKCRISPNGAYLITCSGEEKIQGHIGTTIEALMSDHTVRIWDINTGEILQTFSGHTGLISDVRVSADGTGIVSCSHDGTLRIWDASNREKYKVQNGHTNWVMDCDVSSDGSFAASGSDDSTIKLWDMATGKVTASLEGHQGDVNNVRIAPNIKYLLSASYDGTAKVWDLATRKAFLTLTGHSGPLWDCDLSPDGRTLVTASYDATICLWDFESGKILNKFLGHKGKVRRCVFDPSGRHIISASQDKHLKIWDTLTGKCVRTLIGHTDELNRCEISHSGTFIVSTSEDKNLIVWDFSTGTPKLTLSGHKDKVRGCSIRKVDQLIASTSEDCTIKIWNSNSGLCLATLHVDGPLFGCAWSPDNRHIVATGARGVYFLEYQA